MTYWHIEYETAKNMARSLRDKAKKHYVKKDVDALLDGYGYGSKLTRRRNNLVVHEYLSTDKTHKQAGEIFGVSGSRALQIVMSVFLNKVRDCKTNPVGSASEIKSVVSQLFCFSEEERLEVFNQFCVFCGSDNPLCFCERDD